MDGRKEGRKEGKLLATTALYDPSCLQVIAETPREFCCAF